MGKRGYKKADMNCSFGAATLTWTPLLTQLKQIQGLHEHHARLQLLIVLVINSWEEAG